MSSILKSKTDGPHRLMGEVERDLVFTPRLPHSNVRLLVCLLEVTLSMLVGVISFFALHRPQYHRTRE